MKRTLQLFLILFIPTCSLFSQNVKYGVIGGLTYVVSPSEYRDDPDTLGTTFGLKSNYHLGGKVKVNLAPVPIRITGSIIYTSFSGSRNNIVVSPVLAYDIETSTSLFTVAFGAEYLFSPEPVSPYAGIELQLNSQGSLESKRVFSNGERTTSRDGVTRFGIGLGAGIDLALLETISLDLGLKLNLVNLFGKKSTESTFSTFNISLSVLYNSVAQKAQPPVK